VSSSYQIGGDFRLESAGFGSARGLHRSCNMKPSTFGRAFLFAVWLSMTPSVWSGCNQCHVWQELPQVQCRVIGTATLASPARLALPTTVPVERGNTCLATDNTCSENPSFYLGTVHLADGNQFVLTITVPQMKGAATYTLPLSSPVSGLTIDAALVTPVSWPALTVVSGTIAVDSASPEGLHATFALELELSTTGERFSLSGGTVDLSGCHVGSQDVCVGGD
jgi:hypothetical protein